jgi:predicted RNase H-like nuclease (RuvC/YqgF family)
LANNFAQQEAIRREKAMKVTVLRRKLLRKEETIKKLKKELQLSKEREINLQKKLANHIKVEDRAAYGEVGATFLINQVRHE